MSKAEELDDDEVPEHMLYRWATDEFKVSEPEAEEAGEEQ